MKSKDLLTRSQAAKILQVSVSTVRRLEARQLEVELIDGVHYFRAEHVQALATNFERPTPRSTRTNLSAGELAREVFKRFEQGQGLSEIVQALAIDPKRVRALYHEWRTPLELTELVEGAKNPQYATPARDTRPRVRSLTVDNPQVLLDALPTGQPTRLSVASYTTDWCLETDDAEVFHEQGGFVTYGPVTLDTLRERYGSGRHRITAYDLAAETRLWECYCYIEAPLTERPAAARPPAARAASPTIRPPMPMVRPPMPAAKPQAAAKPKAPAKPKRKPPAE